MKEVLFVAVGGAVGSAGRYLVDRAYGSQSFPLATLTVNLVGETDTTSDTFVIVR